MGREKWLIYGATGATGTRIIEQALKRGHRPGIAGRSAQKLAALGHRYGLHWDAVDLADDSALRALLSDYDLVVNVANPFVLFERAIETGHRYPARTTPPTFQSRSYETQSQQWRTRYVDRRAHGRFTSGL